MSQGDNKCSCTCRWVVASHAPYIFRWINKQLSHDSCNSVRRIVFGIVATTIGIVILYKVFKYRGEEIIASFKGIFKRETCHITNQRTAKGILLVRSTRNHIRYRLHNGNSGLVLIEDIEDVRVFACYTLQCRIEQLGKLILVLSLGKKRNKMFLFQDDCVEHGIAHLLIIIFRHGINSCKEILGISQSWIFFFSLIDKLVIKELVEENLHNNHIFVTATSESVLCGSLFQVINQRIGLIFYFFYIFHSFVILLFDILCLLSHSHTCAPHGRSLPLLP